MLYVAQGGFETWLDMKARRCRGFLPGLVLILAIQTCKATLQRWAGRANEAGAVLTNLLLCRVQLPSSSRLPVWQAWSGPYFAAARGASLSLSWRCWAASASSKPRLARSRLTIQQERSLPEHSVRSGYSKRRSTQEPPLSAVEFSG